MTFEVAFRDEGAGAPPVSVRTPQLSRKKAPFSKDVLKRFVTASRSPRAAVARPPPRERCR